MGLAQSIAFEWDRLQAKRAINKLAKIDKKLARKSVKTGVTNASKLVLKELKGSYVKGKTGLFRRSLARKVVSYNQSKRHLGLVGQRYNKHFSSKAKQAARRKNHGLSTGISGTGRVVPIHLVENPTRRHTIKPRNARVLAFIPRKVKTKSGGERTGGKRDIVFAKRVSHPGTKGQLQLEATRRRTKRPVVQEIRRQVEKDLQAARNA